MSKFAIFFAVAMLVMGTAIASVAVPSPYLLMEPGPAMEVGPMISVPDEYRSERGSIYLTSVSIRAASVAQLATAVLDPSVRLLPREDVEPDEISTEDYRRIQVELLEESKAVAKFVALRELGYDVDVSGNGARVEAVLPNSPAREKLAVGDTIVAVNGRELATATELVGTVRSLRPGDNVTLTVLRGSERLEIQSTTIESTSEPGQAMLGVLITTQMFDYKLPFAVQIDTNNLAGPSAGLMFTLGIVDSLTAGDLTKGHKIAGTGTIAIDGTVGKIDGVKQKVIGAERAGAEYYLAPEENYEEARLAARTLKVVSVRTIGEALTYLSTLEEKPKVEAPAAVPVNIAWASAWHWGQPCAFEAG